MVPVGYASFVQANPTGLATAGAESGHEV